MTGRRVGRLGRQLLVQRRRREDPGRVARDGAFPQAPLSGLLQFNAIGHRHVRGAALRREACASTTCSPATKASVSSPGGLSLRGELLTLEFEVASPRLAVSGSGRIALTDEMDAELTVRFRDTSLDPYIRFFEPRLSPFTTAVAGGTMRVVGELADIDHLVVETQVEQLDLKLFDYRLSNRDPATNAYVPDRAALDQHVVDDRPVPAVRRRHRSSQLERQRRPARLDDRASKASGDANLGILQGFFREIRSSRRRDAEGAR